MTVITANDLKTKGVSLFETLIHKGQEAVITVRGKRRYVVMGMEDYIKRLTNC